MALSNAESPVAEKPKKAREAVPSVAAERQLARASESGDPAVHKLLAERQIALSNEDEDAVAAAEQSLADIGFAV